VEVESWFYAMRGLYAGLKRWDSACWWRVVLAGGGCQNHT